MTEKILDRGRDTGSTESRPTKARNTGDSLCAQRSCTPLRLRGIKVNGTTKADNMSAWRTGHGPVFLAHACDVCGGHRPPLQQKMIIRARSVVTMDGAPIEDGAVRVTGNRIGEVGEFPKFASHNDEILDLGECILLPGLINAHCHLDYTCLRGKIPRQKSFTNWIRAINGEKAGLTARDYVASINAGLAEARRFGTTTIANLTAFPELIANIDEAVQTWWFDELIDLRGPKRADEIAHTAVEALKSTNNWVIAQLATFTACTNVFRRCHE